MFPYRTIVVATDFSECSRLALREALAVAEASAGCVHLLHVSTLSPGLTGAEQVRDEATGKMTTMSAWLIERNDALLRAEILDAGSPRVPVDAHVRIGDVVRSTVAFVEEVHADLLVVGTHGRTGWRHMVLGSVAERLVQVSPVPVLTAKSRVPCAHEPATIAMPDERAAVEAMG
jgi:nucleotide-binding universal stress UspA family protein